MKQTAKNILERYQKANSIKSTWDTEYRQVFEYCMPSRDGYAKASGAEQIDPNFQDRRENLYSSVGEQSVSEFANTMQEVLAPPQGNWIALEAGMRFKEEMREDVNVELQKMCKCANEYKNNSNFDMAFSEFCYDLYAGTACILTLPESPLNPIVFKAIPLREYCIEEGINSEVRAVYRKFTMKRELLKDQWKELKTLKQSEEALSKDVDILESTFFDYDLRVYHYQVIDMSSNEELVHREYKTNPFTVLRWNKCAGEPYGRGVGITAINDIKTLNLIKYYSLRNLAFNTPPLLVQEDAMLDTESLELTPFSLNVVPDTSSSIVPLNISTNYDIEGYKTQELEMQIKKNTFGFTLPNEGSRQLTATEINSRQAEMRRSLNSVFGRLLSEFQLPLVRRIFDVLGDAGVFGKEHKEKFSALDINGIVYKVNVVTPMMKILRQSEAQSIIGAVAVLAQLDPTGELIHSAMKVNPMLAHFLMLSGVPMEFVNSAKEISQAQQQQAQAKQAQVQQAQASEVDMNNQMAMGQAMAKKVEQQ